MKKFKSRRTLSSSGRFIATPEAFGLSGSLGNVVKMEFDTQYSDKSKKMETVFSPDRVLIDFAALDPDELSTTKIRRDCEILKQAVSAHPRKVKAMAKAFQAGDPANIRKAAKMSRELGLTEEATVAAGGGILLAGLLVLIAVGAGGCAIAFENNPPKSQVDIRPPQPTPTEPETETE